MLRVSEVRNRDIPPPRGSEARRINVRTASASQEGAMTEATEKTMEDIALKLDNGAILDFRGRLFSEASWYD